MYNVTVVAVPQTPSIAQAVQADIVSLPPGPTMLDCTTGAVDCTTGSDLDCVLSRRGPAGRPAGLDCLLPAGRGEAAPE